MSIHIGAVSPSLFRALRSCGLNVAFARALSGTAPSTPAARLGSAAHDVLAAVAKGELADPEDARFNGQVEGRWESAMAAQAAEAAAHPVEAAFGPPEAWPGFNDIRSRMSISARWLGAERRGWTTRRFLVEERIRVDGEPVWGTPDLVVEAARGEPGFVADHKSGHVTDADVAPRGDIRSQLLIYAHLARLGGIEVSVAEVRPLGRASISFAIEQEEVDAVLAEVLELSQVFNEKVTTGSVLSLARTGLESCGWCPYAAECEALWSAPAAAFGPRFQAVSGVVAAIEDNGRSASLELDVDGGTVAASRVTIARLSTGRIPELSNLEVGDRVRLAGLVGEEGSDLLRADRGGWPRLSTRGFRPLPTSNAS